MAPRALVLILVGSAPIQAHRKSTPVSGDQRTEWFRKDKFGMFIHWGAYAEIGRHEWIRHQAQIPQAEYDKYANREQHIAIKAGQSAEEAVEADRAARAALTALCVARNPGVPSSTWPVGKAISWRTEAGRGKKSST